MNKNHTNKKIIVVGGGPAGLMAAGQAASLGVETFLLERKSRPGRKLSITGKGRCNLTNIAELHDFIDRFGRNGKFLYQAFDRFFSPDLQEFFINLGVDIKTERGGRVFPQGDNAPALTKSLVGWAIRQGVVILTESRVKKLCVRDNSVTGVQCEDGKTYEGLIIIATGGRSYPATGSTGDGYELAESVGHSVTPAFPSLVPLEIAGDYCGRLKKLSLRNVNVKVIIDGKKKSTMFGEMRFTPTGVSGPVILRLSRKIIKLLKQKVRVELYIDLKPALDEKKLDARLLREFKAHGKTEFSLILKELLPISLIPVCLELVEIPADKFGHQISSKERKRLLNWLKGFKLTVTGHRAFKEAIVTAGGVATKEIDPRTMASKLVSGLYLAGELIDVDGDTGGYNLQAAFSTGWLAGQSAAKKLLEDF